MKFPEKNKEELIYGNYSGLFLSVLLTYSGFSFFPSETASILETENVGWSNIIFELFFLLYPILPVLGLVVIICVKSKRVGAYSIWFPPVKSYGGTLLTDYWPYWWPWKAIVNLLLLALIGVFIGLIPNTTVKSRHSLILYNEYQECSSYIQSQLAVLEELKKDNLPLNAQHIIDGFNGRKGRDSSLFLTKADFTSDEYTYELISLYRKSGHYNKSELIIELISLKLKYEIENLKYTLEDQVKVEFNEILRKYQPFTLVAVLVILTGLFLLIFFGNGKESLSQHSFWVKSITGCYVLMLIQLSQPIDSDKINLRYPDFKYTQRNWYLPSFIKSSFNQVITYDQREYEITMEENFDDFNEILGELTLEMRIRNQKIDSLSEAIETYMTNGVRLDKEDLENIQQIKNSLEKLYK